VSVLHFVSVLQLEQGEHGPVGHVDALSMHELSGHNLQFEFVPHVEEVRLEQAAETHAPF